jgi:hypothetical protein
VDNIGYKQRERNRGRRNPAIAATDWRSGRQKGTTPARGEEAEVVVYQPRGVGLMHTRHKPGHAHYTHVFEGQRKTSEPYEFDGNRAVTWKVT